MFVFVQVGGLVSRRLNWDNSLGRLSLELAELAFVIVKVRRSLPLQCRNVHQFHCNCNCRVGWLANLVAMTMTKSCSSRRQRPQRSSYSQLPQLLFSLAVVELKLMPLQRKSYSSRGYCFGCAQSHWVDQAGHEQICCVASRQIGLIVSRCENNPIY